MAQSEPVNAAGDYGALMERFVLHPPSPSSHLTLHGLTFAVKDIFDVAGMVTGFGNPDWRRTHQPAERTAPAVLAVLAAGAECAGKTVMDEMAYSIDGENVHYGTPANPCVADRVPGGSSSGSAVAVGAGLVDFSLGTDTGGSVRVPAAYCGIFGFRPSHGAVSTENVIPMAQSFDTVGWFARDISVLSLVGSTLLPLSAHREEKPTQILIPKDCFEVPSLPSDRLYDIASSSAMNVYTCHISNENLGELIRNNVPILGSSMEKFCGSGVHMTVPALALISHALRSIQRTEFGVNHGEWVNDVKPKLGPGIEQRVMEAVASRNDKIDLHLTAKEDFEAFMLNLLGDSGVLIIPTVPGPPPRLHMDAAASNEYRARAFSLLAIAGLSGSCQIAVPLGMHDGQPVSVSILARRGADRFLLGVAQQLCSALREQAAVVWGSER